MTNNEKTTHLAQTHAQHASIYLTAWFYPPPNAGETTTRYIHEEMKKQTQFPHPTVNTCLKKQTQFHPHSANRCPKTNPISTPKESAQYVVHASLFRTTFFQKRDFSPFPHPQRAPNHTHFAPNLPQFAPLPVTARPKATKQSQTQRTQWKNEKTNPILTSQNHPN